MPRLVKKSATGPVKVGEHDICMCGLSENAPFCDASHHQTEHEHTDKLYWYANGEAEEIVTEEEHGCTGECADGGCANCQN